MPTTTNKTPVACFAPPLTEELLAKYSDTEQLFSTLAYSAEKREDVQVRDAFLTLLKCVQAWWELPESKRTDGDKFTIIHQEEEKTYAVTPLEKEHVASLDSVTPWMRELNTLSDSAGNGLFDSLPAGDFRNAAFHLLWLCKEITLDREPITNDLIKV